MPRLESEEEESARGKSKGRAKRRNPIAPVVGHEELFEEVKESIQGGALFLLLVALATVIAAIGMLREDLVILVGAMVMAPLLGPNVAAALAATLGDRELAWTAAKKGASSILVVLAVALVIGLSVDVDPENEQLSQRTEVQVSDVGLALVAGMAGTLAFTTLVPTAVMGVLVAVALLPPLVAAGLLLGAGFWDDSSGALLLVAVYVVGINLAGLLMFLLQGVRPERNKEQPETRRQTWIMIAVWALLLVIFGTLVAVAGVAGELLP